MADSPEQFADRSEVRARRRTLMALLALQVVVVWGCASPALPPEDVQTQEVDTRVDQSLSAAGTSSSAESPKVTTAVATTPRIGRLDEVTLMPPALTPTSNDPNRKPPIVTNLRGTFSQTTLNEINEARARHARGEL